MKTYIILLLSAIAAYLYLNLFLLPGTPILLDGDQVYFWTNGQRLLSGELPYRDFYQYTPPGTDFFFWAAFRTFGTRIWVLNGSVLLLGVALSSVCYDIARKVVTPKLAILAPLVFVTLIYSGLLNGTHHWFSVLGIMCALTTLVPEASPGRLFTAGVLLGIASFFTHTHGVIALLAISVFLKVGIDPNQSWRSFWRMERLLLAGFALVLLPVSVYFVATVGWKDLLYMQGFCVLATISKPRTPWLGMPGFEPMPGVPLWLAVLNICQYISVYTLLPVTYFLVGRRVLGKSYGPASHPPAVALLGIVGTFLLLETLLSLNWLRLYAVALPGIVLFTWLISTSPRLRPYAVGFISLAFLSLAVQRVWWTQHQDYAQADLPAGWCAMDHPRYDEFSWLMQHTKAGDFLFDANWPGLYVPLHLRNPVFLDTASSMLNPLWANKAVQQLNAKRVRYVIWEPRLNYPVDPRHDWTSHIVPLRNYLRASYQRTKVFPNGEELWERKEFSDFSIAHR
ncbi:MAG: hypothetical protein J2P13_02070 [Acidobacteria bacterium]|nr:hypothetical protein [Acidobacteriota bacterium]